MFSPALGISNLVARLLGNRPGNEVVASAASFPALDMYWLHVFASSSDWFIQLCSFVKCDNFHFYFKMYSFDKDGVRRKNKSNCRKNRTNSFMFLINKLRTCADLENTEYPPFV